MWRCRAAAPDLWRWCRRLCPVPGSGLRHSSRRRCPWHHSIHHPHSGCSSAQELWSPRHPPPCLYTHAHMQMEREIWTVYLPPLHWSNQIESEPERKKNVRTSDQKFVFAERSLQRGFALFTSILTILLVMTHSWEGSSSKSSNINRRRWNSAFIFQFFPLSSPGLREPCLLCHIVINHIKCQFLCLTACLVESRCVFVLIVHSKPFHELHPASMSANQILA